jgi:hypothetical protein
MDSALSYAAPLAWTGRPVRSWSSFHDIVKRPDRRLLTRIEDYPDVLLVAGCQRSGTTALSRLVRRAEGFVDHTFGHDDELDGALLLAGYATRELEGRHCFQTTYLNDRYHEYFEHSDFRLIWMLRDPRSVVHSMLYNWKRAALTRLYDACGIRTLGRTTDTPGLRSAWFGPSRLLKACASYVGKTAQTFALRERLQDRIAIVDYDELVARKYELLPQLCDFAGVAYTPRLAESLHDQSVRNGAHLREKDVEHVERFCSAIYERARALRTIGA